MTWIAASTFREAHIVPKTTRMRAGYYPSCSGKICGRFISTAPLRGKSLTTGGSKGPHLQYL